MKQENYLFIVRVLKDAGAGGRVTHNLPSTALQLVTSPGSSMGHTDSQLFWDPLRRTLQASHLQQVLTSSSCHLLVKDTRH